MSISDERGLDFDRNAAILLKSRFLNPMNMKTHFWLLLVLRYIEVACSVWHCHICIGYHMSGEVMSVLSLEERYYNCHERAQRARDNYDIVTRVIKLISPHHSCDNLFITYLCLYQALNRENTGTRSECVFH